MSKSVSLLCLVFLLSALSTLGQAREDRVGEKNDAPYDTINIKFALDGTPSAQAAGFDNAKGFWQLSYRLQFVDDFEHITSPRSAPNDEPASERTKRIRRNNKDYAKIWKKMAMTVIKARTEKKSLAASDRELTIRVKLSPEILNTLASASRSMKNPAFRITVSGKVSTVASPNIKFKQKTAITFVCPTKMTSGETQYWMANTCGASFTVVREGDKISFGLLSRL